MRPLLTWSTSVFFALGCAPASPTPLTASIPAESALAATAAAPATSASATPQAKKTDDDEDDFAAGWKPDPNLGGRENCLSECAYAYPRCVDYMQKHQPNRPEAWQSCDLCRTRCGE